MKITPEMMVKDEKRWYARDVITELSYCGNHMRDRKDMTNLDIRFYAYLMRKAHDMLKAQEARVIELSEITPHVYVWVEDRNEKTLFPLKGGMVDPDGDDYFRFVENVNADYVYWPTVTYGKWWRVWNLMPSPEQMRDTKWEGDKNDDRN